MTSPWQSRSSQKQKITSIRHISSTSLESIIRQVKATTAIPRGSSKSISRPVTTGDQSKINLPLNLLREKVRLDPEASVSAEDRKNRVRFTEEKE
jgi:hypothetical protein